MSLPYYALASAGLWAVSANVVSVGLARLPDAQRRDALLAGLLLAQTSGALALSLMLVLTRQAMQVNNWPASALSGVLTYPLATGLYYLASVRFGDRAEVAAQFSQVKPAFSLLFAVLVLGEPAALLGSPAAFLMLAGVAQFMLAGRRQRMALPAVGYGLLTALCWSLGEVSMGIAAQGAQTLAQTLFALLSGLALSLPLLAPASRRIWHAGSARARWLLPFALHGLLSFAAAYACFFYSVGQIGLAPSVLINGCWPLLALLLGSLARGWQHVPGRMPLLVWSASLCFLLGSISHLSGH